MKIYRLIKKYPSLPKDWELGMEVGRGDRGYYSYFTPVEGKYEEFRDQLWYSEIRRGIGEYWEESINNNPLGLEVGKEYWLKYLGCKSTPQKLKITRITQDVDPWIEGEGTNGIVSPNLWEKVSKEEFLEDLNLFNIKDIKKVLSIYKDTDLEVLGILKQMVEYKLEENEKVK